MSNKYRLIFSCVVAAILLLPASASAEWGSDCTNHTPHCYALAQWNMGNESEKIEGLESNIDTTSMYVGDWDLGGENFVSNEQWAGFPADNGNWVEDGQMAGGPTGSTNVMDWFWALKNNTGLYVIALPTGREEGYAWNNYKLISEGNGSWCAVVNGTTETCGMEDEPSTSKRVTVGMEAASETEPENYGKDQTWVEWTNGTWHHWNEAKWITESHTCASLYEWIAGNINFSTC